ncbi:MAG: heme exporter protein CcmD [Chromatiaceae bacterium]|nr:heme exporter protein CcmD [Gammaproteobacteria bacterium]MCP5298310.1 heme exporter protein CcmD [Chromatiaceae bacterium]MCP5423150.1 heme exporter protein CcmD [Chromatiaceae bacterium]
MAEFFHMGGYGLYVWGSFGVTALCMIAEPLLLRGRSASIRKRIARIARLDQEAQS